MQPDQIDCDDEDLRGQIARLEAHIEKLSAIEETCRKSILMAKVAMAAGGILIFAVVLGTISKVKSSPRQNPYRICDLSASAIKKYKNGDRRNAVRRTAREWVRRVRVPAVRGVVMWGVLRWPLRRVLAARAPSLIGRDQA